MQPNAAIRPVTPPFATAVPTPAVPTLDLVLVTETFPPEVNGVSMTLGRLVGGLRTRGHRVRVVRPRLPRNYPNGCPLPGHHVRSDCLRPGFQLPNYPELRIGVPSRATLRARWRHDPPQVVHVATEGPLGVSAIGAAGDLSIPCTSSFHTNFDQYARHYQIGPLKAAIGEYLRQVHRRTRCTMVPTRKQADELTAAGYPGVSVLSRGIDAALFDPARRSRELRTSWGVGDHDVVFTTVGRLAAEKNLDLAVRCLAEVRKRHPTARLVLVGDGPDRPRFENRDGIITAGMRCDEDLATHYASADVFLFPSLTETYGNVLCEAMASGLACVGFDYAAASEVVRDGDNGLLAPFGDDAAFVQAAGRLADDEALRVRLAHAARGLAATRSWAAVVGSFESQLHAARR